MNQPKWTLRGRSTLVMASGGAFLGVLVTSYPGAIVLAVMGAVFGWLNPQENHGRQQ